MNRFAGLFLAPLALLAFASMPLAVSAADIQGKVITLPATEHAVKVEYYRAPGDANRATVLMLHGGQGWGGAEGRFENFQVYARKLADHGFDAYLVYYYSDSDVADRKANAPGISVKRFPAWAQLVSDLTADVKRSSDSNGRVGLVGFSNGGNLSAHATPLDKNIDAAVVYYGGVSRVPGYEAKRFPPMMIFHGEADTREPIERGRRLYEAVKMLGGPVEFHSYPGINHGFGQNLGTPAADDAFQRTLAFLDHMLKGE
jgi:carboxymethylenebutenolidase